MAFQSVPNAAGISVRWGLPSGVQAESTFYAQYFDSPDSSQLNELVVAVWDATVEGMLNHLSNLVTLREVYARGLTAEIDAQATYADTVTPVGVLTGQAHPNNVSFALARRSGLTGRSSRGRIFWPLVSLSQTIGFNYMVETQALAMIQDMQAIDLAIQSVGATSVIVSRFANNAQRPVGVTFPIAAWGYTDLRLDTRRMRLPLGE